MTPATHGRRGGTDHRSDGIRRWFILSALLALLIGTGFLTHVFGASPAGHTATAPVSMAAPVGAESSSWYCTGGTGSTTAALSPAAATLYFTNGGATPVSGTITVENDAGVSASAPVLVPRFGEITMVPSRIEPGNWLTSTVALDGGGVAVSEIVDGPLGWAEAPCASASSPNWYFAAGSTSSGDAMYLSLFNPSVTTAVVDLTFATTKGTAVPQNFQGLVVGPGATVVAQVASYVQDRTQVSTIVQARSGRVVAALLEEHTIGQVSGLALDLGAPTTQRDWTIPRTVNVTGGHDSLYVFNPSSVQVPVTVQVRIPSGPLSPYRTEVPAESTWILAASNSTRIPSNLDYSMAIRSGAHGVVVARVVHSASVGAVPQWGMVDAVPGDAAGVVGHRWLVPTPAVPADPPVVDAAPFALAIENVSDHSAEVHVGYLTDSGIQPLGHRSSLHMKPGAFVVIEPSTLENVGAHALEVRSSSPLGVMEDATPSGMPGVVALPGMPFSR